MYFLKIEAGNGFQYCELPKNFKFNYISDTKYKTHGRDCITILKNEEKYDLKGCELVADLKDNLFGYSLPRIKTKPNCEAICPFFKVITYYVKEAEEGYRNKTVIFDGKAYLIKENGKTIESF